MNNNNYINIQGWMINELKLKGNELILYAIIYGFSQDGQSEYYGSQRYISKAMGISLVSANKLINKLISKKLVKKTSESHYKCITKFNTTVKESLTPSVKESLTNNNNTNNKNNNKLEIDSLLKKFEEVDVKNKTYYGNTTQRKACDFLLKEYGEDRVLKVIDFYLQAKKSEAQYLPVITSPFELKEKWSKLADFVRRNKIEQDKHINNVIF